MKNVIGIYAIFRLSDNQCFYIGESKDAETRLYNHLHGRSPNTKFNIREYYGKILETHETDDKQYRLNREAYWIDKYNPVLNVIRGRHYPEESRKSMSIAKTGHKTSIETKNKISSSCKGRTSPNKGKIMSEEQKQKISAKMKGRIPWNKKIK